MKPLCFRLLKSKRDSVQLLVCLLLILVSPSSPHQENSDEEGTFFSRQQDPEQKSAPCMAGNFRNDSVLFPCVFPFSYKGETFSYCTSTDHDRPWCKTERGHGNCQETASCFEPNRKLPNGTFNEDKETSFPTTSPSASSIPSFSPSIPPTEGPTSNPTDLPSTLFPSNFGPTPLPTNSISVAPVTKPTLSPSINTQQPSIVQIQPTRSPTTETPSPTRLSPITPQPSQNQPTTKPVSPESPRPSTAGSVVPNSRPTQLPTRQTPPPTQQKPTASNTLNPTRRPTTPRPTLTTSTQRPTPRPSPNPTRRQTPLPTKNSLTTQPTQTNDTVTFPPTSVETGEPSNEPSSTSTTSIEPTGSIFPSVDLSPFSLFLLTTVSSGEGLRKLQKSSQKTQRELLSVMQEVLLNAYMTSLDENQVVVAIQLIIDESEAGGDPIVLAYRIFGTVFFDRTAMNLPSKEELDQITADALESEEFLKALQNSNDLLLSRTSQATVQVDETLSPTASPDNGSNSSGVETWIIVLIVVAIIAFLSAVGLGYFLFLKVREENYDTIDTSQMGRTSATQVGLLELDAGIPSDNISSVNLSDGEHVHDSPLAAPDAIENFQNENVAESIFRSRDPGSMPNISEGEKFPVDDSDLDILVDEPETGMLS